MPSDPRFKFDTFYEKLRERGYVIYPGKLTVGESFRIGCIGRVGEAEMQGALTAIKATMDELGVRSGAARPTAFHDPAEARHRQVGVGARDGFPLAAADPSGPKVSLEGVQARGDR